ncbi:MAG: hypothetical protein VX642_09845 [Bdellovibrionota bacterium]|nr:hypothetical protein [Bdellovibrionota bacterium]
MICKSLILFSLFIASCSAFASQNSKCELENLPLDQSFDFKYFVKKEAREPIDSLSFLKALNGQWLPLLGKHSDADIRLLFQKNLQAYDQRKYIEQSFFYLHFAEIKYFEMGLLDFGIHSRNNLKIENPTFTSAELNQSKCQSPDIIEWSSNNPSLPGTKLYYKYYGAMSSKFKSKAPHLEIYFPQGTKIRLVKKEQHIDFGLNFSEDLFHQDDEYNNKNKAFRRISGAVVVQAQNQCPKLDDLSNSQENLSHCYLESINDESMPNWKAYLHINQRNARWMTRFTLEPPDEFNMDMEFYAGLSSLSYNNSVFLSNDNKRSNYIIRLKNEGGPQYTDIDQNRVPSVGTVNGDGNWDPSRQYLNISISNNKDLVEIEYLEKISENDQQPGKRLVRAFFGTGEYRSP